MTLDSFGLIVLTVFLVSFALTALGFAIAWPMDSTQAFDAIIKLILVSATAALESALLPCRRLQDQSPADVCEPATYGVEALRTPNGTLEVPSASSADLIAPTVVVVALHVRISLRAGESANDQASGVRQCIVCGMKNIEELDKSCNRQKCANDDLLIQSMMLFMPLQISFAVYRDHVEETRGKLRQQRPSGCKNLDLHPRPHASEMGT